MKEKNIIINNDLSFIKVIGKYKGEERCKHCCFYATFLDGVFHCNNAYVDKKGMDCQNKYWFKTK